MKEVSTKIQNRNEHHRNVSVKGKRFKGVTLNGNFDGNARLSAAVLSNAFIQYAHLVSNTPKKVKKGKKAKAEKLDIEKFFNDFNNPFIDYLHAIGHKVEKDKCLATLKEIIKEYGDE
tara:strand:+ start:457 stop:810 length:354 start_codon:yes stop_codon:yes gene_type:complete